MDCLFCKIINKDIPCFKIYEDENVLCFLDINPDCNGHTLVIPKKHILDIDDMDSDTYINLLNSIKKVKKILESKLNIDGLTIVQNNGEIQIIKHFHIHLKPFYKEKQELIKAEDIYNKIMN